MYCPLLSQTTALQRVIYAASGRILTRTKLIGDVVELGTKNYVPVDVDGVRAHIK